MNAPLQFDYTTFPTECQEWFYLIHENQRRGHPLPIAVALADAEQSEIQYCDDCGCSMKLDLSRAMWCCPARDLEVGI